MACDTKAYGLYELIFKRLPDDEKYTMEDLQKYKSILLATNMYKRNYNVKGQKLGTKGYKYNHIITPLVSDEGIKTRSKTKSGKGLPRAMTLNNNASDYVHWDDPNELVDSLRLLDASRRDGHNAHDNEMLSIIEELRLPKTIFEKGDTPNWTTEVFKIVTVQRTNPVTYLLEDYHGELVAGTFYEYELHRATNPDVYLVKKVLRRKGDKVYVKWSSRLALTAEDGPQERLEFLARYPAVAKIAGEFEISHLKRLQEATADFDTEDEVRTQFDKIHYKIKAKYFALTSVKLPKIALPVFSGDASFWPSFIALYNTLIHHNGQLANIAKYQYLLASLLGEALQVIKNVKFDPDHYSIAYDLLIERYQNKRRLSTNYWHSLVHAKPLKTDSAKALRQLLDTFNANTRALQMMEFPVDSWDFVLFNTLLDKLTPSLQEKFEAEHRKTEIPKYAQLTAFLGEYIKVFASMTERMGSITGHPSKSKALASSFVASVDSCPVCGESHLAAKCSRFFKLPPKERHSTAKKLKMCFNCLRLGHGLGGCTSTWTYRECGAKHHTLLHLPVSKSTVTSAVTGTSSDSVAETVSLAQGDEPLVTTTSVSRSNSIVLLSTVRAEALDVNGAPFSVRILLDSANQANFITENCMRRGGFSRTKKHTVIMAVNNARAATTRGNASFVIQPCGQSDTRIPIEATILPWISAQLPGSHIESEPWNHLDGLKLADPHYHQPGPIDVLIGADVFTSLLQDGRRVGARGEPDAFNTIFGWVLLGSVSSRAPRPVHSFLTLDTSDDFLSRFWQLEEVPDISTNSEEDRRCEELFARTTRREVSGFKVDYHQFMQDYLDNGHMELITQPFPTDGAVFYLPHHGVLKLDCTKTKLRVIFDASAVCSNGLSLNRTLLAGPKLQVDIMAILLRFRFGTVALSADVKQMFRQEWLDPSQRDREFRFEDIALRGRHSGERAFGGGSPGASETTAAATRKCRFEFRKWSSSHPAVLGDLDPTLCDRSLLSFESAEEQFLKILGLRWYAQSDSFGFQVNPLSRECTKRTILSEVARIFDPLGFLTPLTFAAKRLIQKLWVLKVDWDDQPPAEVCLR
ncbi:PREDICTED: uncharacterized protein LOC105556710 [Vollenhovia emeryi]|uniref:uncharacterized protein LOC105556710 n=1 Tax=Vollenhovia emeryi TaxID=411798 RepID=UPI0005F474C4|nr:PREDICTED: uncharacterized protein LOC105556710 [Vollenhovia emeryi]